MAKLFNKNYSRRELESYGGDTIQFGGIRPVILASGRGNGVRAFEVDTGGGLSFTVLTDRGLDITRATYNGMSLSWHSCSGPAHPSYYESQGLGWLRTFPGGLVTTCGLEYAGAPETDEGKEFGLHGRISHLPAEELGHWSVWRGDDLHFFIRGTITEGVIFGYRFRMTRTIHIMLGSNVIDINDEVVNTGATAHPHMMLYHINFGHPLLSADTRVIVPVNSITPRDEHAATGLIDVHKFDEPTAGYRERCFYHDILTDSSNIARIVLLNSMLRDGMAAYVEYDKTTLPCFTEWKQMGFGDYVVGLEPSNCRVEGRSVDRAAGRLVTLEPGDSREYSVKIGVLSGDAEIDGYLAGMPGG